MTEETEISFIFLTRSHVNRSITYWSIKYVNKVRRHQQVLYKVLIIDIVKLIIN